MKADKLDAARAALDDARRIRSRLNVNDFSFLAQPQEIEALKTAGLL